MSMIARSSNTNTGGNRGTLETLGSSPFATNATSKKADTTTASRIEKEKIIAYKVDENFCKEIFRQVSELVEAQGDEAYPGMTKELRVKQGMDKVRLGFLAGLVTLTKPQGKTNHAASWVISMIEAAFPGLVKTANDNKIGQAKLDITWVGLPVAYIEWLNDADADTMSLPLFPKADFRKKKVMEAYDGYEELIYGAFGIFAYAIAKPISDDNIIGFMERRPSAVMRRLGMSEEARAATIFEGNFTSQACLSEFAAFFANRAPFRKAFLSILVDWVEEYQTMKTEMVSISVKLLENITMTHISLMWKLCKSYGDIIKDIPGLNVQYTMFLDQYRMEFFESDDRRLGYAKAFSGDRAMIINSSQFPDLLGMAKAYAQRSDSRYKQYGADLNESIYMIEFEKRCYEADLFFPMATSAAKAANIGVTGDVQAQGN